MLLDLEQMAQGKASFAELLAALLDELSVPAEGKGRAKWLMTAAGIQALAAGKWLAGRTPRVSNLQKLTRYITETYTLNVSEEQLLAFLTGKLATVDVGSELTRLGLSSPEQGLVLTTVSTAMNGKNLDPLDDDNLMIWTKVVVRVARFYATKAKNNETPSAATMTSTANAYLDLAINDAI
ncbi:MAG: hypothetical protein AAF098_06780 [Pseudomonadota bacterium]